MSTGDIALLDYGDRASWLAARSTGIGASESAALFGLSPWQTPLSLWALKTGKVEEPEIAGDWIRWGNLLEEPISQRYTEVTGRTVWRGAQYAVAVHPTIPIMRATPDRWVLESPDRDTRGLLQIKNTNAFKGHDWDEGPPDFIQVQVQHEMAVTGLAWASVAVLIGGCEFRHFDVERNPAFIEELEQQCRMFWRYVERDEQPPADPPNARTLEALKRLHPCDTGEIVTLPVEATDWWDALQRAKAQIKDGERAKDAAEVALRAAIGSATFGALPDGRVLSLKTTSNPGYTNVIEPYAYRTLRLVTEPKTKGKMTR